MDKILIADAGGTSTQWCLSDGEFASKTLNAPGINATLFSPEQIVEAMQPAAAMIAEADCIYFYGAGCASEYSCDKVTCALKQINRECTVEVASDLIGACRALFGNESGVSCILGTGSNSCLYIDGKILRNIPPLGYLVGDEGSGASLGKRLVKQVLRGHITSPQIIRDIEQIAECPLSALLSKIYEAKKPNTFLASFARVAVNHKGNEDVKSLIDQELDSFFASCVSHYDAAGEASIGFIGSLAKALEPELRNKSLKAGFTGVKVEDSPITGLINYHFNKR